MNYKKIYDQLIEKRKVLFPISKDKKYLGQRQNHHIIPKVCGGNNSKDNLVCLELKEHFIAHWLLSKIYEGTEYELQMKDAFAIMCHVNFNKGDVTNKIRVTSKVYEKCQQISSKVFSIRRRKIIPWNKGSKGKGLCKAWNKGLKNNSHHSLETRQKISSSLKGKKSPIKGRVIISNGVQCKIVIKNFPLPEGWHYGRK